MIVAAIGALAALAAYAAGFADAQRKVLALIDEDEKARGWPR